jgi:hypothetical protein
VWRAELLLVGRSWRETHVEFGHMPLTFLLGFFGRRLMALKLGLEFNAGGLRTHNLRIS